LAVPPGNAVKYKTKLGSFSKGDRMSSSNPLLEAVIEFLHQGKKFTEISPDRTGESEREVRFSFVDGTCEARTFSGDHATFMKFWKQTTVFLRDAALAVNAFDASPNVQFSTSPTELMHFQTIQEQEEQGDNDDGQSVEAGDAPSTTRDRPNYCREKCTVSGCNGLCQLVSGHVPYRHHCTSGNHWFD
jgi:hypothetical protein